MTQAIVLSGDTPKDHLAGFASIIEDYEHRVGHATRAVSTAIPSLLKHLPEHPVILDNACGTGAVTETLVDAIPSARIYATDTVPAMISATKLTVESSEKLKKAVADIAVMDGEALRFDDNFFDASIMNFGIFFFPHPQKGASEAYRTLKSGGTAIFTLWKYFGFKAVLWAVQDLVAPANPLTELPLMDAWTDGTRLQSTLREGGFENIEMVSVDRMMWGRGQEDFEQVLLENFEAMVARNWTDEEKAKLPGAISEVLKDKAHDFTIQDGDKIGVKMTAWVAVCRK